MLKQMGEDTKVASGPAIAESLGLSYGAIRRGPFAARLPRGCVGPRARRQYRYKPLLSFTTSRRSSRDRTQVGGERDWRCSVKHSLLGIVRNARFGFSKLGDASTRVDRLASSNNLEAMAPVTDRSGFPKSGRIFACSSRNRVRVLDVDPHAKSGNVRFCAAVGVRPKASRCNPHATIYRCAAASAWSKRLQQIADVTRCRALLGLG